MPVFERRRERGAANVIKLVTGVLRKRIYPSKTIVEERELYTMVPIDAVREITWDQKNPGPPFRAGEDFANIKKSPFSNEIRGHRVYSTNPQYRFSGSPWYEYTGGFVRPNYTWPMFGLTMPNNDPYEVLDDGARFASNADLGPGFFNRMKPRLERVETAVALAESRDLPGMLKQSSKGFHDIWKSMGGNTSLKHGLMSPKSVADHFINHQFGWKPFLDDLDKFQDTLQNAAQYMDRVSKMNGNWIKKRRAEETIVTDLPYTSSLEPGIRPWEDEVFNPMCKPATQNGMLVYGQYEQRVLSFIDLWAEGSFKYYRPEFDRSLRTFDSNWSQMMRLKSLFGLHINPSVIWKATPWTWLIDWFSDVGQNIDTITDMVGDSMVNSYLYLMQHKKYSLRHTANTYFWDQQLTLSWDQNFETKQRERYNHHFGLNLHVPYSARQLAILAALGISRRTDIR